MLNLIELREENGTMIEDNGNIKIDDILYYMYDEYISDAYSVYADNKTPIYNSELIKALKSTNVEDYMQEAIYSLDIKNYDLYQHIQAAYFMLVQSELYDKDTYIKEYYIINKLIEDYNITEIDNIVYDDLVSMGDLSMIEKISQLDDIVEEIVEEVE